MTEIDETKGEPGEPIDDEPIDELSRKTLVGYIKKAETDVDQQGKAALVKGSESDFKTASRKFTNRLDGVERAKRRYYRVEKLAREDAFDDLSASTVKAYGKLSKNITDRDAKRKPKDNVEEEIIDELSKRTLGRYVRNASQDAARHAYDEGRGRDFHKHTKKEYKRYDGIAKAVKKLTKEGGEEDKTQEPIDELSVKKLARYAIRAKASGEYHDSMARAANDHRDRKEGTKHWRTATKRHLGVNRALNKIAKEDVEQDVPIDELSKYVLSNYKERAAEDKTDLDKLSNIYKHRGNTSRDSYGSQKARIAYTVTKSKQREQGIQRASKRLGEDEQPIDELSKRTLSIYKNIADVVSREPDPFQDKETARRKTNNRKRGLAHVAKKTQEPQKKRWWEMTKEDVNKLLVTAVTQEPMEFASAFETAIDKILTSKLEEQRRKVMEDFNGPKVDEEVVSLALAGLAGAIGVHAVGHMTGEYAAHLSKKSVELIKHQIHKKRHEKEVHAAGTSAVKKELERPQPRVANDNAVRPYANDNSRTKLKEDIDDLLVTAVIQEPMDFANAFEDAIGKMLAGKIEERKEDVLKNFLGEGSEHHVKEVDNGKYVDSHYKYVGHDHKSGLHAFKKPDGGTKLFARTNHAPKEWHLMRAHHFYEPARHAHPVREDADLDEGVASWQERHVKEVQGQKEWNSHYKYVGHDKKSGLHVFQEPDGKPELFSKRNTAPSGWHLRKDKHFYEFAGGVKEDVSDLKVDED